MKPITMLVIIGLVGIAILSINTFEVFSADKAGIVKGFSDKKSAESVFVTITTNEKQISFNTFFRIGIIRSDNPRFLLESVPSYDNKEFVQFVSENIKKNMRAPGGQTFDVAIDILASDGTTIETLEYWRCQVDSYFVYSNDSKGTYSLLNQDSSKLEIRDVTTFDCLSMGIET